MKTAALALLALLLANAQAFRCTVDGAVAYQQQPCAGGVALALPRAEPASEWKTQVEAAIAVRDVMPGMTSAEVLRSWGKPTVINRTVVGERVSEQWVYRRGRPGAEQYLYLDDGVLRTVQSPA